MARSNVKDWREVRFFLMHRLYGAETSVSHPHYYLPLKIQLFLASGDAFKVAVRGRCLIALSRMKVKACYLKHHNFQIPFFNSKQFGVLNTPKWARVPFSVFILLPEILLNNLKSTETELRGLSPRANYRDWATATYRRSWGELLRTEDVVWATQRFPMAVLSVF
jgi:hypothetical protein